MAMLRTKVLFEESYETSKWQTHSDSGSEQTEKNALNRYDSIIPVKHLNFIYYLKNMKMCREQEK
jgi:hypothetical protein